MSKTVMHTGFLLHFLDSGRYIYQTGGGKFIKKERT